MILITIYLNRSIAIKEKEMIMKYRKDRYGNELSQLGFGCMRFTRKGAQIIAENDDYEVKFMVYNLFKEKNEEK